MNFSKKFFLNIAAAIMLTGLISSPLFSQTWSWAKAPLDNPNQFSVGNSVACDQSGNVYVTGSFGSDSITFGSILLTNSTPGYLDMFLVKYDASGNVLWAKSAGGTQDDAGVGVSLDSAGNIFVCGSFNSDSLSFGTHTLHNSSSNLNDIFLVEFSPSGNITWSVSAGGTGNDTPKGLCTDNKGHVFVGGIYSSSTMIIGSSTISNSGSLDIFLVRYDTSGQALWAKGAGGSGSDLLQGVCSDRYGNAIITGSFYSSSIAFGTTIFSNSGGHNLFLAKYDTSGTVTWARQPSGLGGHGGNAVCSDGYGKIYLAGAFAGSSLTFGSITLTNPDSGSWDACLVKYDSLGTALWARQSLGACNAIPSYLASNTNGDVFIGGTFSSASVLFGPSQLTNAGAVNMFIARYGSGGNSFGAISAGGSLSDYLNGLSVNTNGDAVFCGYFSSANISFGTIPLVNSGSECAFVASVGGITGITSFVKDNQPVSVYPNPFHTLTTFRMNTSSRRAFLLILYDSNGKELKRLLEPGSTEFELERTGLEPGLCFFSIEDESRNVIARGKLIIQ